MRDCECSACVCRCNVKIPVGNLHTNDDCDLMLIEEKW
jgi:hypothetical protein